MNRPQHVVQISHKSFNCLGEQLLQILNLVQPFVNLCTWYGVDVEINGDFPFKWDLQGWIPKRIGNIDNLMSLAKKTDQFLCGVFFAVPNDLGAIWNREFSTEDPPFRDMEEAILEIRAFDTSYFEVYSNDINVMKLLSNKFSFPVLSYQEYQDLFIKKTLQRPSQDFINNQRSPTG